MPVFMSAFMSRLLTFSEIQTPTSLKTKTQQSVFTSLVLRGWTEVTQLKARGGEKAGRDGLKVELENAVNSAKGKKDNQLKMANELHKKHFEMRSEFLVMSQ